MQSLLDALTPAEQRAVALVGLMIRLHGGKDGDGLFTGLGRYAVLTDRLRLAAERSRDVRGFWSLAHASLRWSIGYAKDDAAVLSLIAPRDDDRDTLDAVATRTAVLVMIARQLNRQARRLETGEPDPALPDYVGDPLSIFDQPDETSPGAEETTSATAPAADSAPTLF